MPPGTWSLPRHQADKGMDSKLKNVRILYFQAMTKVYGKCHEEIGAFNDTKYIVGMLDRVRLLFVVWCFSMCKGQFKIGMYIPICFVFFFSTDVG